MAKVSYDTLTITINADSQQANKSINTLSKNLRKLDETAKDIDKEQIEQVKGLLLDIANIDFSNVSKGLRDVVSAFKSLENVAKATTKLGSTPLGLTDISQLDPDTQQKINEQAQAYLELTQKIGETKLELQQLTLEAKRHKLALQDTSKATNDFGKTLKKLTKDFGRILKYRVLRKIIQEIFKALTSGFKSVLQYDEKLQASYNKIRDSLQYLTDSLGAVLSPIIQALEPALTTLADGLAEISNELAKIFAQLNGASGYAKAIKGQKDWNKEMQKATTLGIDEINVISQNDNSSNYEWVELDKTEGQAESLKDLGKSIAKIIGEIIRGIKKLLPLIQPILEVISGIVEVLAPVFSILTDIIDIFSPFIEIIKIAGAIIKDLLSLVASGLSWIAEKFKGLMANFSNWIKSSFDEVKSALVWLNHNWDVVGEAFMDFGQKIQDFFSGVGDKIKEIWNGIGEWFKTAFDTIRQAWENIWLAIANFFIRAINFIAQKLEDFLNWALKGFGSLVEFFGGDTSNWGVKFTLIPEITSFATGGFPKEDGLFMANHNELVGQFSNGQTAVANNEQITTGIYQAVRDAMTDANGGQEIVINLDGNEIARVVSHRQKNTGSSVLLGGNIKCGV